MNLLLGEGIFMEETFHLSASFEKRTEINKKKQIFSIETKEQH